MRVKFQGIYTIDEFFQALLEQRERFHELGIKNIRHASLYYQPVDEFGDPVTPRHRNGDPIDGWKNKGPYKSAATDFGL
ncbi:MAG: hypothetical protein RIA64_08915 [Rhodospirillales bacterium]|nr:hypothetical protein [Alphaproteobacteria bacterium HT1-32]